MDLQIGFPSCGRRACAPHSRSLTGCPVKVLPGRSPVMCSTGWRKGAGVLVSTLAAALVLVAPAVADDQQQLLQEFKARLDKLEKQNEELRKQLSNHGPYGPYRVSTAPENKAEKQK